jgi:hypothetical protein
MSTPAPVQVAGEETPPFFYSVGFSVVEIHSAFVALKQPMEDLISAHMDRKVASLKVSADTVAKLTGQINQLAAHLSSVCDRHTNGRK